MRKYIALFLLLLPVMAFAQMSVTDYAIYSKYLQQFRDQRKGKADFVIKQSIDFSETDHSDLISVTEYCRSFVKGDYSSLFSCRCDSFVPVLQKDTLWIALILQLDKKIREPVILENKFSPELAVNMISQNDYQKIFGNHKHIDKNWVRFHKKYRIPAFLVDLSAIANDGKRAAFYFASRCGGLCGNGSIILFYKDGDTWKFLSTISIWNA